MINCVFNVADTKMTQLSDVKCSLCEINRLKRLVVIIIPTHMLSQDNIINHDTKNCCFVVNFTKSKILGCLHPQHDLFKFLDFYKNHILGS